MAEGLLIALILLGVLLAPLGVGGWVRARLGEGTRASVAQDGVQEVEILVRRRYRPDTVIVMRGVPVRMLFSRQEDTPCSERVIFSDFQQERWLAPFAITTVQFIPTRTGEFLFTCALGMYQGRLLVEEPAAGGWMRRFPREPGPGSSAPEENKPDRRETGRRCAVCGAPITGPGVERYGRAVCRAVHEEPRAEGSVRQAQARPGSRAVAPQLQLPRFDPI